MSEPKKPVTVWAAKPGQSAQEIIDDAVAWFDRVSADMQRRSESDLVNLLNQGVGLDVDDVDALLEEGRAACAQTRRDFIARLTAMAN